MNNKRSYFGVVWEVILAPFESWERHLSNAASISHGGVHHAEIWMRRVRCGPNGFIIDSYRYISETIEQYRKCSMFRVMRLWTINAHISSWWTSWEVILAPFESWERHLSNAAIIIHGGVHHVGIWMHLGDMVPMVSSFCDRIWILAPISIYRVVAR